MIAGQKGNNFLVHNMFRIYFVSLILLQIKYIMIQSWYKPINSDNQ